MLKWLKDYFASRPDGSASARANPGPAGIAAQPIQYCSDLPISAKREDRFNRWPFAKRIADTLAERADPSSLVVGLYGPWGDGKTSTLKLMEIAFSSYPQVVVVRFNPWYFRSEENLLSGFFGTLAEALDRSLPTRSEKAGEILKEYGSILSLASLSIGGVISIKPGEAAKSIGEVLSKASLEELKGRLEKILDESGKRVVIMIDDIDRLDRAETHALLKLVKLSAGFRHTRYVLAFDDEMVAAAIGERFGQGSLEAGRNFLEKIVQVPLHLPPADTIALRTITFQGVQAAIDQARIVLTQAQADAFSRHFVDGLEPGLDTPRRGKVYVNALAFALPILKGEVHPVDLMLLEGIRVFYPKLYSEIRDNQDIFLSRANLNDEENLRLQRLQAAIERGLPGRTEAERTRIRRGLLAQLFPRISNVGYGPDWDRRWAREQRACSEYYFNRYFAYGVPPGDASDVEVENLLATFEGRTREQQDLDLRAFSEREAVPHLVRKLRARELEVPAPLASVLALASARNGAILPKERGLNFGGTVMQGAILVSRLVRRVPQGQAREALAENVIENAAPLPFAFECLRWIRTDPGEANQERIVSVECEERLRRLLTDQVRARVQARPLYLEFGEDTHCLYWIWNEDAGGHEVSNHLRERFVQHPEEVDDFLDTFVGEQWGMMDGLPSRADFRRDSYDAIARLIDVDVIFANLRGRYGAELDNAEYHHDSQVPIAKRIALQFAHIHQRVREERAQAAQPVEAHIDPASEARG